MLFESACACGLLKKVPVSPLGQPLPPAVGGGGAAGRGLPGLRCVVRWCIRRAAGPSAAEIVGHGSTWGLFVGLRLRLCRNTPHPSGDGFSGGHMGPPLRIFFKRIRRGRCPHRPESACTRTPQRGVLTNRYALPFDLVGAI